LKLFHKRTIPKTFEDALQKKKDMLKKIDATTPKTEKQKQKLKDRKEKIKFTISVLHVIKNLIYSKKFT